MLLTIYRKTFRIPNNSAYGEFLVLSSDLPILSVYGMVISDFLNVTQIKKERITRNTYIKATWSVRGFLFLLQNHVNQYKF